MVARPARPICTGMHRPSSSFTGLTPGIWLLLGDREGVRKYRPTSAAHSSSEGRGLSTLRTPRAAPRGRTPRRRPARRPRIAGRQGRSSAMDTPALQLRASGRRSPAHEEATRLRPLSSSGASRRAKPSASGRHAARQGPARKRQHGERHAGLLARRRRRAAEAAPRPASTPSTPGWPRAGQRLALQPAASRAPPRGFPRAPPRRLGEDLLERSGAGGVSGSGGRRAGRLAPRRIQRGDHEGRVNSTPLRPAAVRGA